MPETKKQEAKAEEPTVSISANDLRRLQNTLRLQDRHHFGEEIGKAVGQGVGNIISGIFDPVVGLSQLCAFIGALGKGSQNGILTARAIFQEARWKSGRDSISKLQAKLEKLKAGQAGEAAEFLDPEELHDLATKVDAHNLQSATA